MWEHNEEAAVYKPRRESSPESRFSSTLILDFLRPGLWENKLLLYKRSSLEYFVMEVQTNTPTEILFQITWGMGQHW